MGFDWSSFFASGVKEAGAVAKAKDVSVAAEAKAQAEEVSTIWSSKFLLFLMAINADFTLAYDGLAVITQHIFRFIIQSL